jgi:thioester reductase-like protein
MTEDTNLPGPILLTGASGFLGIHLLRELLDGTGASVTCLMRGGDAQQAKSTLAKKWRWYFPEAPWQAHEARVRVVLGEVGAPRLGLNARQHAEISDTHQVIVNSAGNVSHAGSDSDFFRVNTDAVGTLIELARRGAPKALHHVSTVGIIGQYKDEPPLEAFDESRLEEGQSFANAYSESKYRAEVLLRRAFAEGLSGGAYRVGFIGPHSQSGRFQQNIEHNYTTRYVRACVRLGVAPYLPENEISLTPVDSVARAIVTFARAASGPGRAQFVETPHRLSQYDILRVLHAAGYPVRLLELEEFVDKAPRLAQDEDALSVLMPEARGNEIQTVPIDSTQSQRTLAELGFEYPRVTSAWLGKFLQHAIEVGFIEAPRFWNVGRVIGGLI